ncbi:MAG: hypothetical protein PHS92_00175 [Candidatus Gracilibacteria bacterium]|nr:hypothetical protein [Candidatus Gracilibacteria bacterium]
MANTDKQRNEPKQDWSKGWENPGKDISRLMQLEKVYAAGVIPKKLFESLPKRIQDRQIAEIQKGSEGNPIIDSTKTPYLRDISYLNTIQTEKSARDLLAASIAARNKPQTAQRHTTMGNQHKEIERLGL